MHKGSKEARDFFLDKVQSCDSGTDDFDTLQKLLPPFTKENLALAFTQKEGRALWDSYCESTGQKSSGMHVPHFFVAVVVLEP
jgi:hypothetical protein